MNGSDAALVVPGASWGLTWEERSLSRSRKQRAPTSGGDGRSRRDIIWVWVNITGHAEGCV